MTRYLCQHGVVRGAVCDILHVVLRRIGGILGFSLKVKQRKKCLSCRLRWFETVFHFLFQLNFMKGLFFCSKRLLLFVGSRCCNNLSTYQLLYSHWNFGCRGNLTGPRIHPISSIQLHFTRKVVGELPFLLHQNCLHIEEHFSRKFKKILPRGFGATLIFCNIKVAQKPFDRIFLKLLKNVLWSANNFDAIKKEVHRLPFV